MFDMPETVPLSEKDDGKREKHEAKELVLKRLQKSVLLGQPLLPFLLHNETFEFPGFHRQANAPSISGKKTLKQTKKPAFWDEMPSVASPSTIVASKSLHTVRKLVMHQWAPRVRNGSAVLSDVLSYRRFLSTGFKQLDNLIPGGVIVTGEITEIFGQSAVGKTQMCHQVSAVTVCQHFICVSESLPMQLKRTNAVQGATVLYLDTKGDFSANRLRQMIRAYLGKLTTKNQPYVLERTNHCLARVHHQLVPGLQQLIDALVEIRLRVAQGRCALDKTNEHSDSAFYRDLQLIVIDCITAPFAPFTSGFPGETNFAVRTVISELRRLTADLYMAVFVTNNIRYYGDSPQGCLGTTWAAVPNVSLHLAPHERINGINLAAIVRVRKGQRYMYSEAGRSSSTSFCVVNFESI